MQASLERTTKSLSTTQLHLSILHWEALEGTTTSTLNALDELTIHSKPPAYLTSSLELMTPLLTDPVQDTSGCGCRSGFHLGPLPAILPNVDGSAPSGPAPARPPLSPCCRLATQAGLLAFPCNHSELANSLSRERLWSLLSEHQHVLAPTSPPLLPQNLKNGLPEA